MLGSLAVGIVNEQLEARAPGWRVVYRETVTSTMDVARELADAGACSGTVVVAEEQSAGRGRQGRAWVSDRGGNLYFTVVLLLEPGGIQQLPMIAPLAVVEAIDKVTGLKAELKWPNDVQLSGLKCGGILIDVQSRDGTRSRALVGIGLNVNRDVRSVPELRGIATSVATALGAPVDREAVLTETLVQLKSLCQRAEQGESMRPRWRGRLNTLGRSIRVRTGETVIEGIAEDVGEDGSLFLRLADGSVSVMVAGEVTLRA